MRTKGFCSALLRYKLHIEIVNLKPMTPITILLRISRTSAELNAETSFSFLEYGLVVTLLTIFCHVQISC